jgi:hypothetical protein
VPTSAAGTKRQILTPAFGTEVPKLTHVGQPMAGKRMTASHPAEPIPTYIANGRYGATKIRSPGKAERPVLLQLRDLCRGARERGGCAGGGPSPRSATTRTTKRSLSNGFGGITQHKPV